jgi:aspartate 1-decarboxylase
MNRFLLKSKIHRAFVTHADVHYEGSLTIPADLMAAADILPHEEVHVWNVTRGTRLQTYAIEGEAGSGIICINGAAAHLVGPGEVIIIATFTMMDDVEARRHLPRVVFVNDRNQIHDIPADQTAEVAGPNQSHRSQK